MDAEVMIQALLMIRERCTDAEGNVDEDRYNAAVDELVQEGDEGGPE